MLRVIIASLLVAVVCVSAEDLTPQELAEKLKEIQARLNAAKQQAGETDVVLATRGNSINVRLPRDGDLIVERRVTTNVGEAVEGLETDFDVLQASVKSDAAKAAFDATLQAMQQLTSKFSTLSTQVETKVKNVEKDTADKLKVQQLTNLQLLTTLNTSIQDKLKAVNDDVAGALQVSTQSLNDKVLLANKQVSTLDASVVTLGKKIDAIKPLLVSWKQCDQANSGSGADASGRSYHMCDFVKKEDDTYIEITFQGSQRQINGNSIWYIRVDKRQCRTESGSSAGHLWWRLHGSRSVDLHRPVTITGFCHKTDNNQFIKKGTHRATVFQSYVSADSYYGWETSSRMIIKEYKKDQANTITPNPGSNGRADW
eukprot:m.33021 g.33021  ORF g.33021 m.33021 type:complete len:371 (-) comp16743_c0_seq1:36-1148(-)